MLTCPPLPSFLAHHLANPLLGKILLISGGETESIGMDEESNQGEQFTSNRSNSHAAIREWIRLLRFVDRLLFIIYIIVLIIYHS